MKVFVSGGSGFLGTHLIPMLIDGGFDVVALAVSSDDERTVTSLGAQAALGDLTDATRLEALLEGCEIVVHAAAHMDHWGNPELFHEVNVIGTRNILSAAERVGIRRFVHLSAASIVLSLSGTSGDETLPVKGVTYCHYSHTKAKAESFVIEADKPGFETIALRPPMIWGTGDKKTVPALAEAILQGRFSWINRGRFKTSTCHVTNVCDGIVKAIKARAHGEPFFLTDGPARTNKEVIGTLTKASGVTPPERSIPRYFAVAAAYCVETLWKLMGRRDEPPMTRSMLMLMFVELDLDDSRARDILGYTSPKSWEQGIAELG